MTQPYTPLNPPQKALSGQYKHSFGYSTLSTRLPVIVSKIVDDVYRSYHGLSDSDPFKNEKEKEAKGIIERIGGLRYELQRDKPFRPLTDKREDVEEWNQALATYYPTSSWYKASWLFSECYLYRRIKEAFALTEHWKDYDPFFEQKRTVFKSSQKAVVSMAVQLTTPVVPGTNLSVLDLKVQEGPESKGTRDAFFEMVQVSLWGNATDLSLLDNPDLEKVEQLQRRMLSSSTSSNASSANASPAASTVHLDQLGVAKDPEEHASELEKHADKILSNDSELLWSKVKSLRNGRVDIILDNAGFELYVDFVIADYLIRAGFASEIVFHAKRIPWFVSDVMPFDFQWTLDQLHHPQPSSSNDSSSPYFFNPSDPMEQQALLALGQKWQSYVDKGTWKVVSHEFWTSCYSFYHLPTLPSAQDLFESMRQSDLWIFKGDLNYRKLVYDCKWPTTTPFTEAIGPLGQSEKNEKAEGVPTLVSFRTCKADVVVGLAEGVEAKMDQVAPSWMVNGEYAVISVSL